MLRLLDLFSGIGGFSLGLERTNGFKTVAFCEIEPFCRQVLKKHWPQVPCYEDIRELTAKRLRNDGISIDAICGGFPCQDISIAGRGVGIEGERSGLWAEYSRIIGEFRPRYVIMENVAALLYRGLDRVLGDLATLGFDAEWHCIPAAAVGAPHGRERLWMVAYPGGSGLSRSIFQGQGIRFSTAETSTKFGDRIVPCGTEWKGNSRSVSMGNGVPVNLARSSIKALGNAVVPQIPEMIGRAILAREAMA